MVSPAAQAALARRGDTAPAGVVRIDLADEEDVIAPPGNGLAYQRFREAFAVHLGRVDQPQTQVEAQAQRGDFFGAGGTVVAHVPGAHAECRDAFAVGQSDVFYVVLSDRRQNMNLQETRRIGKAAPVRSENMR